ncbi:MAG: dihydrofolate reductase family protein [Humibacillus sp.]|nr:dihydrofolate reductase family protein [Humibacillus sp.]MDN5776754.1 dihydrofolate reductase family protein [Humibacillus sp.]
MAQLIYTVITSLDGYVADAGGGFDWAAPDEEVHSFVNDLERPVGTYLYGRKLYETMVYWETASAADPDGSVTDDFAVIWQAAEKIVYSTTLEQPASRRTSIERSFAPDAVSALVAAAEAVVEIGGPHLAAHALRAGLVDEIRLFRAPAIVGGGTAALPSGIRLDLTLHESRRFAGGTTYARYTVGR